MLFFCLFGGRIGHKGIEILNKGIYFSESITQLNLSYCKLNDADGALIAKTLISNEVCQVIKKEQIIE